MLSYLELSAFNKLLISFVKFTCSIAEKQIVGNMKLSTTNGAKFWKQQTAWSASHLWNDKYVHYSILLPVVS